MDRIPMKRHALAALAAALIVLALGGPMSVRADDTNGPIAPRADGDDNIAPFDRGTGDDDDGNSPGPSDQQPSEDGTEQQEASPQPPDFGGCIFENRDLSLIV